MITQFKGGRLIVKLPNPRVLWMLIRWSKLEFARFARRGWFALDMFLFEKLIFDDIFIKQRTKVSYWLYYILKNKLSLLYLTTMSSTERAWIYSCLSRATKDGKGLLVAYCTAISVIYR